MRQEDLKSTPAQATVRDFKYEAGIACTVCGERNDLKPYEKRRGADGRLYDLWICACCLTVLNRTDLFGVTGDVSASQAESAAAFYAVTGDVLAEIPSEVQNCQNLINFLLDHTSGLPRGRFLDFGAGRGFLAAAATQFFERSYAFELDLRLLRAMRAYLPGSDRIHLIDNMERLPDRIDAIAMWHVVEHLPNITAVVDRLTSRLSPGGAFFFQVPMLRNSYLVSTHYAFLNESSARILCSRLGLSVVGVWFDDTNDFMSCIAQP